MKTNPQELRTVLVTDCGSTTTKALLFERTPNGWRQTFRGEAPTTVEEPVADVTVGALNAFAEVEELSQRKFLSTNDSNSPFVVTSSDPQQGIDLYLSTSSAGGGLQMMVTGLVKQMTTESAQRAALGAGAIILEAVSCDDRREEHEQIERIRHLRPDIVLMTGGVDGGSKAQVLENAEIVLAAAPKPRFGETLRLPVIYAGNSEAATEVQELLRPIADVQVVPNVRPTLEEENLGPARDAIHEFFLSHVMSHSPGYGRLLEWSPRPVMPTPAAVGDIVLAHARATNQNVLCVDIGGATTDVFSVFRSATGEQLFNRTVSANLGMSYSIANVLVEAGVESIRRWLPYDLSQQELRDRLRNKMIRPTSIPQTKEDLLLEQAVCREALRLSLLHHRSLAVGLSGVAQRRGIADIFTQKESRTELVNLMALDLVIGSGGVLSHAPNRLSAALMMLEGFKLEGVTSLAVDSIFMMPHLGVLASVDPHAAQEIFLKDCLVHIGPSVVPLFPERFRGASLGEILVDGAVVGEVARGKLSLIPIAPDRQISLQVKPARGVDVGGGPGESITRTVESGVGIIFADGRNRPLRFPSDPQQRAGERRAVEEAVAQ